MPTAQTAQTAQTFTNHPSRHRPDHCTLAENYCRLGATNAQLAELFEVPGDTLQLWLADLPDFAAAVSLGRATADAEVAESFYRRAKGYDETVQRVMKCRGEPITVSYTKHHLPNAWAGLNWLCNRRPQNWSWHGKKDEAAEDPVDLYAQPLLLGAAPADHEDAVPHEEEHGYAGHDPSLRQSPSPPGSARERRAPVFAAMRSIRSLGNSTSPSNSFAMGPAFSPTAWPRGGTCPQRMRHSRVKARAGPARNFRSRIAPLRVFAQQARSAHQGVALSRRERRQSVRLLLRLARGNADVSETVELPAPKGIASATPRTARMASIFPDWSWSLPDRGRPS